MVDVSNMGRCDLCGKPIDMEHAGHDLVIYEEPPGTNGYPEYGITVDDMREGFAEALERYGGVENAVIANAYVEDGMIILHGECADKTALERVAEDAERLAEEADDD